MNNYLKYLLFSISSLALFVFCAGGDEISEYGNKNTSSLFAPELAGQNQLHPFFLSTNLFYGKENSEYFDDSEKLLSQDSLNVLNVLEWKSYFENKIDSSVLNKIIYKSTLPEIDSLIFSIKNKEIKTSKSIKDNPILAFSNPIKTLDFLYYIGFAKRCEIFTNNSMNSWTYEELNFQNNPLLLKLLKGGTRQANNCQDIFIKERYHFQLIRLHYFNRDYSTTINYFKQKSADFNSKSIINFRSIGYVAGAYYKLQKYAQSNYLYAQIFDNCPQMRGTALWSFHPQEEKDFNEALALAKNNEEKAAMWFMLGYSNDELRAMKAIAKINPKSLYLDILLTRAINNEELNVFSDLTEETAYAFKFPKLNLDLVNFVETQAKLRNTRKPEIWDLAFGYLNLLKGNVLVAESNFKKVEHVSNNKLLQETISLYRHIAKIQSVSSMNQMTESMILPDIKWIESSERDSSEHLRIIQAQEWLHNRLSALYLKQNDLAKAEFWKLNSSKFFYENASNIESQIAFRKKLNQNDYEKYLNQIYSKSLDDLYYTKGVLAIYAGNFELAKNTFALIKDIEKSNFNANPFTMHINDCHDCDQMLPQKKTYNSLSFANILNEKAEKATTENNSEIKAKYYYEIANALYNVTFYGNSRTFYNDHFNDYTYYDEENPYKSIIYDCAKASEFYLKALKASQNAEFKAKCVFMLAKCEQNAFYRNPTKDYKGDFKAGKYFAQLKLFFKDSKYYQEVIQECGYFRTYLSKK